MPSAAFKAKGTFASGTGNVTPGLPAGLAAGDLMLLFVHSANQAASAPSGWTAIPTPSGDHFRGTAGAAGGVRIDIFYRWWQSGDAAPTVTDTGDLTCAIICAYSDVDATTPFDNATPIGFNAAASTTLTLNGITTQSDEALVVHATALDRDAASTTTAGTPSNANLSGLAERHDQTVSTATGGGLVIHDGVKAGAGASGNTTATQTSNAWAGITLSLRSTPPGPVEIRSHALGILSGTLTKPTGTIEGDLMIAVMWRDASGGPGLHADWTNLVGPVNGANGSVRMAYRVAGASEPASWSFPDTSTGGIVTIRRGSFDDADLFGGTETSNTGSSTTLTALGITAERDDSRLLSWHASSGGQASPPSGMSVVGSTWDDASFGVYTEQVDTGASGDRTQTVGSGQWAALMACINPPEGAPSAQPRFTAQIIG